MTYGELKRQLKKVKCHIVRQGKRHEIWQNPRTGQEFQVGRHNTHEVPKGTLNSIKEMAGLK